MYTVVIPNLSQELPNKRENNLSWVNMAVAPNGNLLALIDEKGYMWLGTTDFKVIVIL